jgi:hypothetical protein
MDRPEFEREQEEAAAAEAGSIGGRASSEGSPDEGQPDEAKRPPAEAGEGESEGFEQAEQQLVDHATHGDQHAARRVIDEDRR